MAHHLINEKGAALDALLPFDTDSRAEYRDILFPILQKLQQAIFNQGSIDLLLQAFHDISLCCNYMTHVPLSHEEMASVLNCLWELTFASKPDRKIFPCAIYALNAWIRRITRLLPPEAVELPWRPAYKTWKRLNWVPERVHSKIYSSHSSYLSNASADYCKPASTCRTSMFHYKLTKDNSLGSILERVIKGANKYFCSEAADYILSEIRPYLSATDMSLEFASRALDLFLPTHPRSRHEGPFLEWRHEIKEIWDCVSETPSLSLPCLSLLDNIIQSGLGRVDLNDFRPIIYKQILRVIHIDPARYDASISPFGVMTEASSFAYLCLPDDDLFWLQMDELVHIIEPVLHPSNRSNLQLLSGRFAMNLVEAFCSRREKEMSEDSMIPEHARLHQRDYTKLFHVFKGVLLKCLNSKDSSLVAFGKHGASQLCILAPEEFVPWVVDQMYSGLESLEHHRLLSTLNLMQCIPKFLLSSAIYRNGDQHLVPIMHALLPAIDANDLVKTWFATEVLVQVFQTIPLVDCSSCIPATCSAEEAQVLEATCQFESWVDSFLDSVFELSENVPSTLISKMRIGQEFNPEAVMQSMFMQLSPSLRDKAIDKVADWILNRSISSGDKFAAAIARCAAIENPSRMLSKTIPQLTKTILNYASQEASIDDDKEAVVAPMPVLIGYFRMWSSILKILDPVVLEYKSEIISVFQCMFKIRGKKVVNLTSANLDALLSQFSKPWLPRRHSLSPSTMESLMSDPVGLFKARFFSGMSKEDIFKSIFTYGNVKPLLDGSLEPSWCLPGENEFQFIEELVKELYDPAINFLEECTTLTGKDAQSVDKDNLHNRLMIIKAVASCASVVTFVGRHGTLISDCNSLATSISSMKDVFSISSPRSLHRHSELASCLAKVLNWLFLERPDDVNTISTCLSVTKKLVSPFRHSVLQPSEFQFTVCDHPIPIGRSHLVGLLYEIYACRYDLKLGLTRLMKEDMDLLHTVAQGIGSQFKKIRNSVCNVMASAASRCNGIHAPAITNLVLDSWKRGLSNQTEEETKYVLLGCIDAIFQLIRYPRCQQACYLHEILHLLQNSIHVEDQEVYDVQNKFVSYLVMAQSLLPWPHEFSSFVLKAAERLPAGKSSQQPKPEIFLKKSFPLNGECAELNSSISQWRIQDIRSNQQLLLDALKAAQRLDLTWKHQTWFVKLICRLIKRRELVHPALVEYLFQGMVSELPPVRKSCISACAAILRILKVPVAKIDVRITSEGVLEVVTAPYQKIWKTSQRFKAEWNGGIKEEQSLASYRSQNPSEIETSPCELVLSQQEESSRPDMNLGCYKSSSKHNKYKHRQFGFRLDTQLAIPPFNIATNCETAEGAEMAKTCKERGAGRDSLIEIQGPIYLDKPFWGWYAWPEVIETYAPERYQVHDHFIGRHEFISNNQEDLTSSAEPYLDIDAMLNSSRMVIEQLLHSKTFLPLIIKCLREETGVNMNNVLNLFKGLFRNYGVELLKQLLQPLEEMIMSSEPIDHSVVCSVLIGIVRGTKHWPFQDKKHFWKAITPLLERGWDVLNPSVVDIWMTFIRLSVCELDLRRSAWLTKLLLDRFFTKTASSQSAFQQNINGQLLIALLNEFSWRGRDISKHILQLLDPLLSHAYDLVRQCAGNLAAIAWSTLGVHRNALSKEVLMEGDILQTVLHQSIAPLYTVAISLARSDSEGRTDNSFCATIGSSFLIEDSNIKESIVVHSNSGSHISNFTTEEIGVENHVSKTSSEHKTLTLEGDNRKNEFSKLDPSVKNRIKSLTYAMQFIKSLAIQRNLNKALCCHLTVFLDLLEHVSDKELSKQVKAHIRSIVQTADLQTSKALCNYLMQGEHSWHIIIFALELLEIVGRSIFPERNHNVLHVVLAHLEHNQREVQNFASTILSNMVRMGLIPGIQDLSDMFVQGRTLGKAEPNYAGADQHLPGRKAHAAVLGLSALVQAHPYDLPDWMPTVLVQLAKHTTSPDPLRATANKALSMFWKTHKEAWHETKQKFTIDQRLAIEDVLISPSYYA